MTEIMPRRILITGSRAWTRYELVWAFLDQEATEIGTVVVHGDCPSGADRFAKEWCRTHSGIVEEPHPADWKKYGKKAGPIRNSEMVALGADICGAFLLPNSRGTQDCITKVEAADILVKVTRRLR